LIPEIGFAMRRVLASRTRRRALLALGPAGAARFTRFLVSVVPQAKQALRDIEKRAEQIPEDSFRNEALASIRGKAYHVAGGCIYAAFLPPAQARHFVAVIAPLESLYDYLDNLCDRHPGVPPEAYPVLHEALADALDPSREMRDYFRCGPHPGDGGYLRELVVRTRAALALIPDYARLLPYLREAADYYTSLQTYKHYPPQPRVAALRAWHETNQPRFSGLHWWEFAAASGSQFHVYALLYAALRGDAPQAGAIYAAYFPSMSGLHVLLDDFIDQAEDAAHGELNFGRCYPSESALEERFAGLYRRAHESLAALHGGGEHLTVLRIMTLFYLTHPKVFAQEFDPQAKRLLTAFAGAG
jgi:tetraprenyl-beta-curcumene synthase